MSLSLCMIVKNEKDTLARCLESVKDIVDEIIIVDTGSTDDTVKIAEGYGAKVFFYNWNNSFADARNFSLEKASKDWILIMDADDELKSEDKHKVTDLVTNPNNKFNVYFGQTLSYLGESPSSDIYSNLNVRLIKNGSGYKFIGDIHEQIMPSNKSKSHKELFQVVDIKFYHYGYLNKTINDKNKRKRNIEIIENVLKKNPINPFMLFNMGVEYFAKEDYSKALNYLKKSYENFNPQLGFSPALILRMISCYGLLGEYDEALKLIDEGLKYYPAFTDLEYNRAIVFYSRKEYDLSIKSLKKCLDIGEPSGIFSDLIGVGSFRAYYFLGAIYFDMECYDESYEYLDKALKSNCNFLEAILKMSQLMFIKNVSINEIELKFMSYFNNYSNKNTNLLLSDIFHSKNKSINCCEFEEKEKSFETNSSEILFYHGKTLFYKRNFREALSSFYKIKASDFYNECIYYIILCEIFNKNFKKVDTLFNIVEKFNEPEKVMVYKTFRDIIQKNKYTPLAKNAESSKKYIEPIFHLLETLLKSSSFSEFEKAVQLLNLINDDNVLLLLGKLYYKNGYFQFAYKEFIRSIKIYEKIDVESLEMIKFILICKQA